MIDHLRIATAQLRRIDGLAAGGEAGHINLLALDLLAGHVAQLSELPVDRYADAVLSGELRDRVADIASATKALTAPTAQRAQ